MRTLIDPSLARFAFTLELTASFEALGGSARHARWTREGSSSLSPGVEAVAEAVDGRAKRERCVSGLTWVGLDEGPVEMARVEVR